MKSTFKQPMNDPLENRITQFSLRQAPRQWKSVILKQAAQTDERRHVSWNMISFAAAWAVIALLKWTTQTAAIPYAGRAWEQLHELTFSARLAPEAYLEHMLSEPEPLPPAPRQSRYERFNSLLPA